MTTEWTFSAAAGMYGTDTYNLHLEHGITDEKRRQVGGTASIYQVPDEAGFGAGWRGKWALHIFATRNGQSYGAYPHGTAWDTLEVAQAEGIKRLETQRKSYARKYRPLAAALHNATCERCRGAMSRAAMCPTGRAL